MSLLTGIGQFRAQHVICETGFNPWILLYIYLHWKLFAIVQALTLIKLFYNFSQSALILATLKNFISPVCLLAAYLFFSRPLMMMLYSTDSAKPLWWLFFQQCRISSYPVSCCLTNYLSTPGPVALSKMRHMMLLCDCQCFFPFSPCLHWGCNCPGRFWIPRQQTSQPEHFDYLHLNPLPIKPLQIQPTFLLLLLIFGERPQRETPSWKGL